MILQQEDREAIVKLRIEKAKETFLEAKGNIEMSFWRASANRLYYACFYAVGALLVQNGFLAHTHSGVVNQFGLHFIKTGLISEEYGKFYKKLFELRQTGDYDDWASIDENDIEPLIEKTENFIKIIEKMI